MTLVGIVSDTHGLLRPEALDALRGCDRIIHAGDIGAPDIVPRLAEIAPVAAIRGNIDTASWALAYPEEISLQIGGCRLFVLHDRKALTFDPAKAGYAVVVSGHSHRAGVETEAGTLFVNPGSAGPRRFRLPVTLAILRIGGASPSAAIRRIV